MKLTILMIISLNMLCYSQFTGGSGTVEDPYQIATAEQLNNVRNYKTSSFIQTADIDLGVAPWNVGEGWDPIGDYDWGDPSQSFRGNYDGGSYKILNLQISRVGKSFQGLFGSTEGCTFKSIHILDFSIITEDSYLGGISGISYNDYISDCKAEGYIKGYSFIGLIAGLFEGYTIDNCHVRGDIIGSADFLGGLIALSNSDSIINCSAEIKIISNSDSDFVGGLIAYCENTELINNCYSNCEITSAGSWIGGFIGSYYDSIILEKCFSQGIISGTSPTSERIGGFIGQITGSDSVIVQISNCYSKTDVTGNDKVGGFIGRIYENSEVVNCYSTGQVTGNTNIGGFVGIIELPENITVTKSYWDTETSGIDSSSAGEGRTTAEMTLPYATNTYIDWDFTNVWRDDVINQNNGYPTFLWVSGIEDNEDNFVTLARGFELYQNYPNPFNPVTQIKFDLAKTGYVKLSVYNLNGQLVSELASRVMNAGCYSIQFDGSKLNSGVYYYTLDSDGFLTTKKLILIK